LNEIEEIKDRLDIVELAKQYMTLRQAGRNLKAVCPLHQEKTPSLMVSPDKQIWHCFGCGEGGDIFTLVQKMEGLDFYESLKLLADRAGVELKQNENIKQNKEVKDQLLEINRLAAEFYHLSLLKSQSGQMARDYLERRGVNEEMIRRFKIGYAPDLWDALANFLQKRGWRSKDMTDAGVSVNSRRGTLIDKFRQRLMFPIWDGQGRVVAFTGRSLDDKQEPKYLNTATTRLYDKSRTIYAYHLAKDKIRESREVIFCEGQMDVIACHQIGFKNTVCSSGTAATKMQLQILKRTADSLLVAFDKDEAGQNAAYKLTEMALQLGMIVKVIDMGSFKDPDEMIRQDRTLWEEAVTSAESFVSYFLRQYGRELGGVKDKSKMADKIIPLIYMVPDEIERGHYINYLAEILGVDESFVLEKYRRWQPREEKPQQLREKEAINMTLEERLVGLVMVFYRRAKVLVKDLNTEYLSDSMKKILKSLLESEAEEFSWTMLAGWPEKEIERWQELVILIGNDYPLGDEELVEHELKMLIERIKEVRRESRKADLEGMIDQAEKAGDKEKVKEYIRNLQDLIIKDK